MTAVAMFIPPPIAPGEPSTVEVLAAIVGPKAARRLLQAFGDSLYEIARAHDPELAAAGVPARRIPLFRAAVLLGRRSLSPLQRGRFMPGPDEVWAYYRGRIAAEPVEVFHMLALDARNRVMQDVRAARGSLTGVEVNPRDLFRELIRMGAAGVIFAHNHPSGDPTPSGQDRQLTTRLREVGELCGIRVLDHVVVCPEGYTSISKLEGWP